MQTSFKSKILLSTIISGLAVAAATPGFAQDSDFEEDEVVATGTRIIAPGIVSSSPITSVSTQELDLQQTVEVETLLRDLPITGLGDNQNINNGTAGAATVNLRNLGTQRTLILQNGKRLTPFDINGVVDLQTVPTNLIERVDIVTGGASAVYGSDAMAGAINFIMKDDFQGLTLDGIYGFDESGEAETMSLSALMGGNFSGDRGNAVLSVSYADRNPVLLNDRDFGEFGVSSRNGPSEGGRPASPEANCDGPNATAFASGVGSTTAINTTFDLPGGDLQFRNDRTAGDRCSRFNFSPFNYYQTPSQKFNLNALGHYEVNDKIEAYIETSFTNTTVRQQVAPSGLFGNVFEVPLSNPFLSEQARQAIIDNINGAVTDANTALVAAGQPTIDFTDSSIGGNDLNGNGVFDVNDSITTPVRRRTLELGTRSSGFDQDAFRFVVGARGDFFNSGWNYDVSYQRGESSREELRQGYTNVTNIAAQLNTVSATECITPGGTVTGGGCAPLDIFGEVGTISDAAATFGQAVAIFKRIYTQDVVTGSINGPLDFIKSPYASSPALSALGLEYRTEFGETIPDDCLRRPPASCQGGAGGFSLPTVGGFDVYEGFAELIIPLVDDTPFAENLNLELGIRYSDYDFADGVETWKAGLNWEVNDMLRLRGMIQEAVRAPNVGELAAPQVTGLGAATVDPCSVGNDAATMNPSQDLIDRCVATGVQAFQVGLVNDIISNQVNQFQGTDLNALPDVETASTLTLGAVVSPGTRGFVINPTLSVDYYDIEIDDVIGTFTAQQILNACYTDGDLDQCAKINRINGRLTTPGAGIERFTTNLDYLRSEGIDIGLSSGFDIGEVGDLNLSFFGSYTLSQESQASPTIPLIDCVGRFGNDCNPTPEFNWNVRGTFTRDAITASILWRHVGSIDIQEAQRGSTFDGFESISSENYFDATVSYEFLENFRATFGVQNIFDVEPPIVGNGVGGAQNFGNTFPGVYDVIGRSFRFGLRADF